MSSAAHQLQAAYHACLDETLKQAPLMIERWCSGVVDLLSRRYNSSSQNIEKRHLLAAKVELQNHRELVLERFVSALAHAIASHPQSLSVTSSIASSASNAAVRFDDLALMRDNDLQSSLDGVRVLQAITVESEASLAAFSARLSTAQGFAQVTAERNPLRPEAFSMALVTAAHHVHVDSVVYSLWLAHGGVVLGRLVDHLYLDLNDLLTQRGVSPAAYRVITTRATIHADETGPDKAQDSSWADALETSAFAPLTDESRELPTITFPLEDAKYHESELATPSQITRAASRASQLKAAQTVRVMIDNLANDPRILAPVGRIIASTERIFLQAVAQDIRIASDTSHPARNLLAAIASKSLAFSSEAAAGFSEFLEDVRNLVVHLAQGDLSDPQRFVDLLERFDNKIVERQAVVYENRRGTKQSVLAAAQRNVVAKKIAEEILARRDYVSSNRVIEDFLTGPWSQVLALERQVIDADTTGMRKAVFNLTLGELLWTLNFKRTAAHPKRLAKLSPSVLDRVRGGLLSIDWPPADSQAFFDSVLAIHQASLNSSDAPEPDLTTENKNSPTASVAEGATATPKAEVRSALNRLFAAGDDVYDADVPQQLFGRRGSGASKNFAPQSERRFEPTQPFVDTAPASQPSLEPEGFQFDSVELKLGAWVEMTLDGRQVRAQLTWISLYKTLCIFTSTDGATHSMSESLLHYFLLQGMVKVISAEGVLA